MNKDFEGFVNQQEKYVVEGYDPKLRADVIRGGNYQPKYDNTPQKAEAPVQH